MEIVIIAWLLVFAAAALLRIASALTPIRGSIDFTEILLPYALVALAPVAGYRSATAPFSCGPLPAQPGLRLARYGRWLVLGPLVTRAHHAFGPFGFMASLLIGHAAKRCVAQLRVAARRAGNEQLCARVEYQDLRSWRSTWSR